MIPSGQNGPHNSTGGSNRTPFDDTLLHDPHAPRDTQPLTPPAQNVAAQNTPTANTVAPHPPPQPPLYMPQAGRTLPPQVASTNPASNYGIPSPTQNPTRRLPTSTLLGLAMAGGALGVVLLSLVVNRVLPRSTKQGVEIVRPIDAPPPLAPNAPMRAPGAAPLTTTPRTKSVPSATITDATNENRSNTTVVPKPRLNALPAPSARADENGGEARDISESDTNSEDRIARAENRDPDNSNSETRDDNSTSDSDSSTRIARSTTESRRSESRNDRNSSTPASKDNNSITSARDNSESGNSGGARFTSRRGYAITPPAGYRLQKSGRRTVWRGPDGAQILVETGTANGSPRAGWERLDKALSRKYGSKYRSRGISETTVAGKPAAVWEFEIDTPRGTQRKIDVAVHYKGRGYAVLGEAPKGRFDQVRPQIEAAIKSFELKERTRSVASQPKSPQPRPERSAPRADSSTLNNRADRYPSSETDEEPTRDSSESNFDDPVRSDGY